MKKSFFIGAVLLLLILTSCNDTVKEADTFNAVYFWKTRFELNEAERNFLSDYDVKRLYIRFFDVDVEYNVEKYEDEAVPVGSLFFKEPIPDGLEIIPTVYITLDAIKTHSGNIEELADKIITRILAMGEYNNVKNINEVQLDCDWTKGTEDLFFKLCARAKSILHDKGIGLSSTVRLHQLNSAVPPVDKATLMVYNTGVIKDKQTKNSILDYDNVKPYIKNKKYALPLNFAYPIYSWAILFRDNKFLCLLRNPDFEDMSRYKLNDNGNVTVIKEHYRENIKLNVGDVIRVESSKYEDIIKVKELVEKSVAPEKYSVILYHIDSINISKFNTNEINNIYQTI